jgi:hypothetical protein
VWIGPAAQGDDRASLLARTWRAFPRGAVIPLAILISVPAIYAGLALAFGPFFIALTTFSPVASTFILIGVWLAIWAMRALTQHARATRLLLISRGLCPSCLYEMGDAVEDDTSGTATCPECGSAWDRRPRLNTTITIRREEMRSS